MGALIKLDELLLAEHHSLAPGDNCYYLLEYTSGNSFPHSVGNALITNLKKKLDRKQSLEWSYKAWTIQQLAAELAVALSTLIDFATTTIIPIPPSKTRDNPQYDDRVLQVIKYACPPDADIRESIICREDHASAHETDEHDRPAISELMSNYVWAEARHPDTSPNPGPTMRPLQPNIVLFDDVIASGNHFTACKRFLLQQHPAAHITGIFIARVIRRSPDSPS